MKVSQVVSSVIRCFEAEIAPFIAGQPGIGKSAIANQLAAKYKLKVIDLRLSQCDPTELQGLPTNVDGRLGYLPPMNLPLAGDPIPDGYEGWVLFLDEMNTAPKAVAAAAYKLLDRMVGQHKLHPNVFIIAAGNRDNDGAITTPMSTATTSRMAKLELIPHLGEWIEWAVGQGIDGRILGFLNFRPEMFNTFDPKSKESFACPRTWERVSKLIKGSEVSLRNDFDLIKGVVGNCAREFIEYCGLYGNLATLEEILNNPKGIEIPNRNDLKFAYAGFITSHITVENAPKMMAFTSRLPIEFQITALRPTFRVKKELIRVPEVMAWLNEYGDMATDGE